MKKSPAILSVAGIIGAFVACGFSTALAQQEIIVKALVDGPSDFVVTTNGFQWKNGANAKPGRHEGRNEPTFINERMWYPQWGKQMEDRGVDSSDRFPYALASLHLEFELLAVGETVDAITIEPRTTPTVTYGAESIVISIPDPECGPRWYIFVLVSEPGSKE